MSRMYQVVGQFDAESAPPVCWGGKTSLPGEAQERLAEAEEYSQQRMSFRGQKINWRIKEWKQARPPQKHKTDEEAISE